MHTRMHCSCQQTCCQIDTKWKLEAWGKWETTVTCEPCAAEWKNTTRTGIIESRLAAPRDSVHLFLEYSAKENIAMCAQIWMLVRGANSTDSSKSQPFRPKGTKPISSCCAKPRSSRTWRWSSSKSFAAHAGQKCCTPIWISSLHCIGHIPDDRVTEFHSWFKAWFLIWLFMIWSLRVSWHHQT